MGLKARAARGPALGMLSSRGASGCCSHRTGRAARSRLARESPRPLRRRSGAASRPCSSRLRAPRPPPCSAPLRSRLLLLFLPSLKEAQLGRLSARATHRSANPSRGPANASRSPGTLWRWLLLVTLFPKWGRGGVSPPPLNANTMRRAPGFPALCLLLNLHAAGKGLPGRAWLGMRWGGNCTCLRTLGSLPRKESLGKAKQDSADGEGVRESCTCWKTGAAENLS